MLLLVVLLLLYFLLFAESSENWIAGLWRWCGFCLGDRLGDNALEFKSSGKRGCGWRRPTSHCACPLNVCLASGNYFGI
jgi:hypothetical protein